jgi:putative redox protein
MTEIVVAFKGETVFETRIGNNSLLIDSSNTEAMGPPQLMFASIAACSGALVAGYCRNTGIDATGLTIKLEFDKADNPYRFTNFRMKIILPGLTDPKKRDAVLRVAEHCPVHETMKHYEGMKYELVTG